MNEDNINYKIGDVYLMNFAGTKNEQRGWRPGVVFQNNKGNIYSPNIIALPITSSIKKQTQPTHVLLPSKIVGLRFDSMVLCENPECMSKQRIGRFITKLPVEYMSKIAAASILATSAISYLKQDDVMNLWKTAVSLNGGYLS